MQWFHITISLSCAPSEKNLSKRFDHVYKFTCLLRAGQTLLLMTNFEQPLPTG